MGARETRERLQVAGVLGKNLGIERRRTRRVPRRQCGSDISTELIQKEGIVAIELRSVSELTGAVSGPLLLGASTTIAEQNKPFIAKTEGRTLQGLGIILEKGEQTRPWLAWIVGLVVLVLGFAAFKLLRSSEA